MIEINIRHNSIRTALRKGTQAHDPQGLTAFFDETSFQSSHWSALENIGKKGPFTFATDKSSLYTCSGLIALFFRMMFPASNIVLVILTLCEQHLWLRRRWRKTCARVSNARKWNSRIHLEIIQDLCSQRHFPFSKRFRIDDLPGNDEVQQTLWMSIHVYRVPSHEQTAQYVRGTALQMWKTPFQSCRNFCRSSNHNLCKGEGILREVEIARSHMIHLPFLPWYFSVRNDVQGTWCERMVCKDYKMIWWELYFFARVLPACVQVISVGIEHESAAIAPGKDITRDTLTPTHYNKVESSKDLPENMKYTWKYTTKAWLAWNRIIADHNITCSQHIYIPDWLLAVTMACSIRACISFAVFRVSEISNRICFWESAWSKRPSRCTYGYMCDNIW